MAVCSAMDSLKVVCSMERRVGFFLLDFGMGLIVFIGFTLLSKIE